MQNYYEISFSSSVSLWDKLQQLYAKKTCKRKLYLTKKMLSLKLQEGTSCANHLNTFQKVMNQLSAMGNKFDDETQGLFPLDFLFDSC